MCYSNSSTSTNIDLSNRYRKTIDSIPEQTIYYASGFNFPTWRVITNNDNVQLMKWGLIPNWFKENDTSEIARNTLNARTESIHEKASFKSLIKNGRCIIPSTGFFEWKHENKNKIPYFIFPKNDNVFSMAGLFDQWDNPNTKETITTFSILTCEANAFMSEIHNVKKRMPVILSSNNERNWLKGEGVIEDYLKELNNEMGAHQVDSRILKQKNPNILEAQLPFEPKNIQQTLF
ncbi:MAG: SOS response-associated peptidase [Bacteroidetes bacterium]|nr:SOS response-associated peptidase [Bacteroidota bacterium]